MPPITWQNVMGPSLADASRPLEAAQRSFNGAFDGLGDILKQRAALVQENFVQGKTNNTNEALNQIQQYATPEEFAAAQKSGAIQALLTAHGPAGIDQQVVRAAVDGRPSLLQQRATQGFAYQNAATDQAQAGVRDQIAMLLNSRDPAQIQRGQAMLAEVTLRQKADLALQASTAARQIVTDGQSDKNFDLGQRKGNAEIDHYKATDEIGRGNLDVSRRNANVAEQGMGMQFEERLADRQAKLRAELKTEYDNAATSASGTKAVFDNIKNSVADDGTKNNMRLAAEEVLKIPGITVGVANAVLGTIDSNRWYKLDAVSRKDVLKNAVELAKNTANTEAAIASEGRKGKILGDIKRVEAKQALLSARNDNGTLGGGATAGPNGNFPVIDPGVQRGRDVEAIQMLRDEAANQKDPILKAVAMREIADREKKLGAAPESSADDSDRPGVRGIRPDSETVTPEAQATLARVVAASNAQGAKEHGGPGHYGRTGWIPDNPTTKATTTSAGNPTGFKPDAAMEARVLKENLKMARNEAMDYTPEVKAYVRGKAAAESEGYNKARAVLLKPELERQLREAKAQASVYR